MPGCAKSGDSTWACGPGRSTSCWRNCTLCLNRPPASGSAESEGKSMRVLLAVDASPDSRNAAGMIAHLVEPPDLHVLNVVDVEALQHAYESPDLPAGYFETYS